MAASEPRSRRQSSEAKTAHTAAGPGPDRREDPDLTALAKQLLADLQLPETPSRLEEAADYHAYRRQVRRGMDAAVTAKRGEIGRLQSSAATFAKLAEEKLAKLKKEAADQAARGTSPTQADPAGASRSVPADSPVAATDRKTDDWGMPLEEPAR